MTAMRPRSLPVGSPLRLGFGLFEISQGLRRLRAGKAALGLHIALQQIAPSSGAEPWHIPCTPRWCITVYTRSISGAEHEELVVQDHPVDRAFRDPAARELSCAERECRGPRASDARLGIEEPPIRPATLIP